MFRTLLGTASLLTLALLFPVHARAEEPLRVVTTIETFADLARRVGGDKVAVETLSHGYQDPHFVDARPNLLVTLNRADLLVRVGLDLEVGWLPVLVQGARNERILPGQRGDLDASSLVEVLDVPQTKVTREMGDIHPQGNPHYWLPPVNAVRIAKGLTERLKALRPADAASFDANYLRFVTELKERAPGWDAKAKALAGTKVVTYHRSWSYLSAWLKLVETGTIENKPGVPPSPDHLAQLITQMQGDGTKLILVEDYYNRSIAEDVARKSGARVVPLPANVGAKKELTGYFELVDSVLSKLAGS